MDDVEKSLGCKELETKSDAWGNCEEAKAAKVEKNNGRKKTCRKRRKEKKVIGNEANKKKKLEKIKSENEY